MPQRTLFFSGYAEYAGSRGSNYYLQIYNPTGAPVNLNDYALAATNNTPDTIGQPDAWVPFAAGASIGVGEVYNLVRSADFFSLIQLRDERLEPAVLSFDGNDCIKLVKGTESSYEVIDTIGDFNGDPGPGWSVAGIAGATKNHTLVRKSNVEKGNANWLASAGTDAANSEWVVFPAATWDYLASHTVSYPVPLLLLLRLAETPT